MKHDISLLSGVDIPFREAQLVIHQPTLKEIAFIGEESFFIGSELLNFSKNILNEEDKNNLASKSNFEIFMSIMKDKNTLAVQKNRISSIMVLTLIFPDYKIYFLNDKIALEKEGETTKYITDDNFEQFKEIVSAMFCLDKKKKEGSGSYNPQGEMARKIAEKLRKGREKAAAAKGQNIKNISIISRYMSILSVGLGKTFEELNKYTIYQLFDEFERFELKEAYDIYLKAKLAGAKDIDDVEHWMKDIHS